MRAHPLSISVARELNGWACAAVAQQCLLTATALAWRVILFLPDPMQASSQRLMFLHCTVNPAAATAAVAADAALSNASDWTPLRCTGRSTV